MFQTPTILSYGDLPKSGKRVFQSVPQKKDTISTSIFVEHPSFNYGSNFASEEKMRRQQELEKRQDLFNKKREFRILQEAGRRQAIETELSKDQEKLDNKRSKWKSGQKNNVSEAYNMFTLEYHNTYDGETLRQNDMKKKFREDIRSYNLDSKMNSGFNIITGAARQPPSLNRSYF